MDPHLKDPYVIREALPLFYVIVSSEKLHTGMRKNHVSWFETQEERLTALREVYEPWLKEEEVSNDKNSFWRNLQSKRRQRAVIESGLVPNETELKVAKELIESPDLMVMGICMNLFFFSIREGIKPSVQTIIIKKVLPMFYEVIGNERNWDVDLPFSHFSVKRKYNRHWFRRNDTEQRQRALHDVYGLWLTQS